MPLTLRVDDPDERHAAIRLCSDLPLDAEEREFVRGDGWWTLHIEHAPVARLEYQLELVGRDGTTEVVCDAGNPNTAPGAFGPKSVALTPEYRPPAWLEAPKAPGSFEEVHSSPRELGTLDVRIWSPEGTDGEALPLLVAHDGPEYDALASLTAYCAAMIAAGRLPPHRVALLPPGNRDEWYSASSAYARALRNDVLYDIGQAVPVAGLPVGMGASLGGLAMLHVQRRWLETFGGLFLQSSSFFVPRYDSHESVFKRYQRIVRFVRDVRRTVGQHDDPIPVTLTCGAGEENVHNNRLMAEVLAGQGYDVRFHEVPDLHNYTGWRDAFDPYLTDLLARLWS